MVAPRPTEMRTSLLLCELPENGWRKFACGSWTEVCPAKTAQPATTTRMTITILKMPRPYAKMKIRIRLQ